MAKCSLASPAAMGEDTRSLQDKQPPQKLICSAGEAPEGCGIGVRALPCAHRCFMDSCFTVNCSHWGGTGEFLPVPRGKICLPDICCQTSTAGQDQDVVWLALGSACVLSMYMMMASLLARQKSPSLSLSWLPPVLAGKRPGRRSYL